METMCQVTGCMLVFLGSGYLVKNLNGQMERRRIELRGLYRILLQLKSEMQYMNQPLPICFEHMAAGEKEPFRGWLLSMAERMQSKDPAAFSSIWEEELTGLYERSALTNQDMEPLLSLKDKLGIMDMTAQLKALDYVLLLLERGRNQLEDEIQQKKKVVLSIGLFVGFMTMILFI